MASNPRDLVDRQKANVESLADEGEITTECRDALLDYTIAIDETKVKHTVADGDGNDVELALRTVSSYVRCLRIVASDTDIDLMDTTAAEFNAAMDTKHDTEDITKPSLRMYQMAAKHFFRFHGDIGVDPADINVYSGRAEPRHDETDIFTADEVDALRRACGETGSPVRNRALLELFVFSGQRIGALITLRVKDVELNPPGSDTAYIYLNDDYDSEYGGLKGALARGRKRPIFGAKKYVRDWLQYHPNGDDPEAWLFIGDPNHWNTNPDDHIAKPTVHKQLKNIADYAGVDKPVNAHNFRHYCATVLKRDYDDVDDADVAMLFGHVEGSTTLKDTYQHLFDDDHIENLETGTGYRETDDTTSFTPDACPTCGELLKDGWRQCPNCQEVFGPTEKVEDATEDIGDAVTDAALTEDLSPEERRGLQVLLEVADDPEGLYRRLAAVGDD